MTGRKKILITGAGGLLGMEFSAPGRERDFDIFSRPRADLDISSEDQISAAFKETNPDIVVNCAGYTNVDAAEKQREAAWRANAEGPKLLARQCRLAGVKLVHYSSDSIFDGGKTAPYVESDKPGPLGFYGKTKLEGEQAIQSELPAKDFLILRINWPYGKNGNNFINTVLRDLSTLAKNNAEITAVDDQLGSPSPAALLARKTLQLLQQGVNGIFHLSCLGTCSKFDFLKYAMERSGFRAKLVPAKMSDFPSAASRPRNSALGTERLDISQKVPMPSWEEALQEYLEENGCF